MQGRDWFILGVRLYGVWWLAHAIYHYLAYFVARFVPPETPGESLGAPASWLIYAAGYTALALYFLLGTNHLARLCYGEEENPAEQTLLLDPPAAPSPPAPPTEPQP